MDEDTMIDAADGPSNADDQELCLALVNSEEQYSLWAADMAIPNGWSKTFGPASRDEVLAWVEQNWTDITPKSARLHASDSRQH